MARKKNVPHAHRPSASGPGRAELILVADAAAELRMTPDGFESRAGAYVGGLAEALAGEGVTVEPLFGASEDQMRERAMELPDAVGGDMGGFYHVSAPGEDLEALAERLREVTGWPERTSNRPESPPSRSTSR